MKSLKYENNIKKSHKKQQTYLIKIQNKFHFIFKPRVIFHCFHLFSTEILGLFIYNFHFKEESDKFI